MRKSFYKHKQNSNGRNLVLSSVEVLPGAKASVAFIVDSGKVFRGDGEIAPVTLSNGIQCSLTV